MIQANWNNDPYDCSVHKMVPIHWLSGDNIEGIIVCAIICLAAVTIVGMIIHSINKDIESSRNRIAPINPGGTYDSSSTFPTGL